MQLGIAGLVVSDLQSSLEFGFDNPCNADEKHDELVAAGHCPGWHNASSTRLDT